MSKTFFSQQKLLPTYHKMKQIAIISLTTVKLTTRKQPQPSKNDKVIPNTLDKTVMSLILNNIVMELGTLNKENSNGKLPAIWCSLEYCFI